MDATQYPLRTTALGAFATIALYSLALAQSADGSATPEHLQWTPTKPMLTARYGHVAVSLPNGQVLVTGGFGGKGGGSVLNSTEIYDPVSQRWSKTSAMAIPRLATKAVLLLDGRVLTVGGQSVETITVWDRKVTSLSFDGVTSAEVYSPAHKTWSAIGPMAVGRLDHTLTVLKDGRVLVVGGRSATYDALDYKLFDSAELLDPTKGRWTMAGSMITQRICHTATLLPNGKVLVAGGRTGRPTYSSKTVTSSAELYDSASGTWAKATNMSMPRCGHTATLLPSGKVLVTGGEDDEEADVDAMITEVVREKGSNFTAADLNTALAKDTRPYLNSAELYDPATNQWLPTGHMSGARSGHTALLLSNGSVIVARGHDSNSLDLNSAEIYEPAKGTWLNTGSMNDTVGLGATFSLLPDGKVLAAGGDRGYVESKPGFRERLARGIYRKEDFNENSALSSTEFLSY
ncbi:kelch repeat-containing protein [Serratia sp. Je.1.23.a]|uniref:Kelch repeat-containing protein n=1 Tax=Serratia sp. Je.1.23.a TaxID=3142841 RepID=UPI003DA85F2D